jgi:hypothetical protein
MAKLYPKFPAKIENKRIEIFNKRAWSNYLERYDNKEVLITVEEKTNPRSLSQNAYYWALLRIISSDTGINEDEIHSALKMKFLRCNYTRDMFKLETVRSTTSLSTLEFSEYIDKIKQFSQDFFGIILPSPEDLTVS